MDESEIADLPKNPQNVIQSNYTRLYGVDPESHYDVFVDKCFNDIYVIGLAPSHPIRRKGLKVTAVSFDLHGRTVDSFTVTGKKKGGAVSIRKQTVLCEIKVIAASTDENEDGECETFAFTPMIGGKVLEINKRLLNEPELITSDIEGWIALCVREHYQAGNGRGDQKKRRKVDTDNETDGLLDLEQYKQYLKEYDFDVSPLL